MAGRRFKEQSCQEDITTVEGSQPEKFHPGVIGVNLFND